MAKTRYIFLCNALDDQTKQSRRIDSDSPAATNKVLGLWRGLQSVGGNAVILSMGRGRQNRSGRCHAPFIKRVDGIPVYYARFCHIPILTHLITMVSLVNAIAGLTGKGPLVLVVYNRQWHGLPAAIVAHFLGVRCYLDLEDGAFVESERGLAGLRNRIQRFLFDRICDSGALLASKSLGKQTGQKRQMICYGVADRPCIERKWSVPLTVLFGGSLMRETGVQCFIDAVRELHAERPEVMLKLKFVVTGKGPMAEDLDALAKQIRNVEFRGEVNRAAYLKLLESAHIGLCLKRSDSEMGRTTFPSKTIEIAASGLILVSLAVSDVAEIFSEGEGYILQSESSKALAETITRIVLHPMAAQKIACRGKQKVDFLCGLKNVGQALIDFLDPGAIKV